MPPQLVRVFSLHRQAPHPCPFPAGWVHRSSLSQQAESIVPAFPSRLSPSSQPFLAGWVHRPISVLWQPLSNRSIITDAETSFHLLSSSLDQEGLSLESLVKKKAQGLRRPWRKKGTQTQSQVVPQSPAPCFFQPKSQDCSELPGNVQPFFIHLSSWLAPCRPDTERSQEAPGSLRVCFWDRRQVLISTGSQRRRQALLGGTSWPGEKRSWWRHFCHQEA